MITCNGKKICEGDELPYIPRGSKVLVKPDQPPDTSDGGLVIPDIARRQASTGVALSAGLAALDQMHDQGDNIGDRMLFGQLAGIWQEWDHVVTPGSKKGCVHPGWDHERTNLYRTLAKKCVNCGAIRYTEPLLLMDIDDLQANEDLSGRMRDNIIHAEYATTSTGVTQFRYTIPKKERKAS